MDTWSGYKIFEEKQSTMNKSLGAVSLELKPSHLAGEVETVAIRATGVVYDVQESFLNFCITSLQA